MRVCPKCGFKDDPNWKPLYWKMYWEYMPLDDFLKAYVELCDKWVSAQKPVKQHLYSKDGDFYYDQEDQFHYYKFAGKTRKMVHRFPKGFESMANRKLFEKTPSEKGFSAPKKD